MFNVAKLLICLAIICIIQETKCAQKKKETILAEKSKQLMQWSYKKAMIRMNGDQFRTYIKSSPKNYTVILMLTALNPQRKCEVCKHAFNEFQILANSWRYSQQYNNKLFFAMVDFDEGNDVFQYLKLNQAPVFMLYGPKGRPKKSDIHDIHRKGYSADVLAQFINERCDISIRIFRPPNYSGSLAVVLLIALVAALLYIKRNNLEFLYNKTSWALFCLGVVYIMISGQMWNHIRGPPLMHKNPQTGNVQYIQPGNDGQYIIESYIIMFINAAITFGVLLLNEATKAKDPARKKMMCFIGLGMFAFFFSLLISVFKSKYRGYPYSFLIN